MWPNCLGSVRKAGIRFPHQLVVGGGEGGESWRSSSRSSTLNILCTDAERKHLYVSPSGTNGHNVIHWKLVNVCQLLWSDIGQFPIHSFFPRPPGMALGWQFLCIGLAYRHAVIHLHCKSNTFHLIFCLLEASSRQGAVVCITEHSIHCVLMVGVPHLSVIAWSCTNQCLTLKGLYYLCCN